MKRKTTNPLNIQAMAEAIEQDQVPGSVLIGAKDAQDARPSTMKDIAKIVVLMLENRGFDHVMGWLYDKSEEGIINKLPASDKTAFQGLWSVDSAALANPYPGGIGEVSPVKGARSPKTPGYNPGEHFVHIMEQMWGPSDSAIQALNKNDRAVDHATKVAFWEDREKRQALIAKIQEQTHSFTPKMCGYVSDFKDEIVHHGYALPNDTKQLKYTLSEIIETYLPEQLPVLSGLARHYGISDQWFCSVPSQTNTNRAFSVAGTSRGLVTNNYFDAFRDSDNKELWLIANKFGGTHTDQLPWFTRSMFSLLLDHDPKANGQPGWKIYWQSDWPAQWMSMGQSNQYHRVMLPYLGEAKYDDRFVKIDPFDNNNQLFKDAREGKLPRLSWLEPKWGGGGAWQAKGRMIGTDMHPVADTAVCESFVHQLYEALSEGPDWESTLFIITFDENGGTYDHVPPPAALSSGKERSPYPFDGDLNNTMDSQTRTQFGYDFKSYGVRVPTLFISPRVKKHTLLRSVGKIPFDHTSIIATILEWWGVDRQEWDLGPRTLHAPTFAHVISAGEPRKDTKYSGSLNCARGSGEALKYDTDYYLEYVGSAWSEVPGKARYLGPYRQGMIKRNYYPTLVADKREAVKVRLVRCQGEGAGVANMDRLRLMTTEQNAGAYRYLGTFTDQNLYYYKDDGNYDDDLSWELRMLCSRDRGDTPQVGELLTLVSGHKRSSIADRSEFTLQDVPQRMAADLDGSGNFPEPTYLTTRAGEWDLWRLVAAG